MKGHSYIWELRKKYRLKPKCIFIEDWDLPSWMLEPKLQGATPAVSVYGDFIPALDLRFVKGCVVSASSDQECRAKALFERLKAFQPSVILASHHISKSRWPGFEQAAWFTRWEQGKEDGSI